MLALGRCSFPLPLVVTSRSRDLQQHVVLGSAVSAQCAKCRSLNWDADPSVCGAATEGPQQRNLLSQSLYRPHPVQYFLCHSTKKVVKHCSSLTESVNKHILTPTMFHHSAGCRGNKWKDSPFQGGEKASKDRHALFYWWRSAMRWMLFSCPITQLPFFSPWLKE